MEKDLSLDPFQLRLMLLRLTGKEYLRRKKKRLPLWCHTQTHRHNRKRKGNHMNQTNGKNAYEIRLEVLSIAVSQADGAYYNQVDLARTTAGDGKVYQLPEDNRTREALKIAKKLYAFVEGEGKDSE